MSALNRFFYPGPDGERTPPLVSKITDVRINAGERMRLETPGGGGFGDPAARDPAKIARDLAFGYITPDEAAG